MAAIFFDNGSHIIGNIPTITPFAIYVGNCPLAFSTQWYGQNIILTTFIFEQKIKHHFKYSIFLRILLYCDITDITNVDY
jgi:hypothetical protein